MKAWMPFEEARAFVHRLGLKGSQEWQAYCTSGQKPENIPAAPMQVYRDQWKGMGDWLGTGYIAHQYREFLSFEGARGYVKALGFKNRDEWQAYCHSDQKPDTIPVHPERVYRDQWKGMGDWLGTGTIATFNREFLPFEEARAFVQALGLESRNKWGIYCKSGQKPASIPATPNRTYQEQWQSWGDWLGTGTIGPKGYAFLPFEEARTYVHRLGLKCHQEWKDYCTSGQRPENIPSAPDRTYREQWQNWGDWLGTGYIAHQYREYLSFEEARTYVRSIGLNGQNEWKDYCRSDQMPKNIPSTPNKVYSDHWQGLGDWLGTATAEATHERITKQRNLEAALIQLHASQQLSSGQIMILMRHAGVLSKQNYLHASKRLLESTGQELSEEVKRHFAAIEAAIDEENEVEDGITEEMEREEDWGRFADPVGITPATSEITSPSLWDEIATHIPEPRDREQEIKELRGWSAIGNLIDPSPALVQLSVTRLKTAFYRFANELRGHLSTPLSAPSQEELERFTQEVWDSAFGEYGDLLGNALIQEAIQTYASDLAGALLLPRYENGRKPRVYQLDAARFLAERLRSETTPYALLFDQPGMGKTLETLWALAAAKIERLIIVAPLTVKRQVWTLSELQSVFPHLQKHQVARTIEDALKLPLEGPAVVLLHYEELRKHPQIKQLVAPRDDGTRPYEALIVDEAHEVKVRAGDRASARREGAVLLRQGVHSCIGLTATPVVNELFEPISLLHLAQNNRDPEDGNRLQSRRLRDRVDVMEYMLADTMRRLKQDVLTEIPPRQINPVALTPTTEQMEEIESFLHRGRRAIGSVLSEYRRMMLSIKLAWIADRVAALSNATTPDYRPDPKVLILCYNVEGISRSVYKHLIDRFGANYIAHIDGSTPLDERDKILEQFKVPSGISVLVGTVGTVGTGVTLFDPAQPVTPHRVIFADLPYTWAEFEQGIDRLHRVGQRFQVEIDVPLVTYGEQITQANGEAVQSFDEWVWEWIARKQVLSDQVLDAEYDISGYKDSAIRKAISQSLKAMEAGGGAVVAPPPPPESVQAKHRHQVARCRTWPRERVTEYFQEPGMSEHFLEINDASPAAKLAQRLVRERLAQWLDKRSLVVDLGCGSNPLRDLPCQRIVGIDRHGVNGGLIGDSAATGLASGEADFVVFSLSMWGTPQDRLCYLREAKRVLRPPGRLIIVEPMAIFGSNWKQGVARLSTILELLGMQLVVASEHIVDSGARLVAIVAANSNRQAVEDIDPETCIWAGD